jgi:tetratricopeptide (TPR) repeat protein
MDGRDQKADWADMELTGDKGADNSSDEEWGAVLSETTKLLTQMKISGKWRYRYMPAQYARVRNEYDKAITDYAAAINIALAIAYRNRGLLYWTCSTTRTRGSGWLSHKSFFSGSCSITPVIEQLYWRIKQYDKAPSDFDEAIYLFPDLDPTVAEEEIRLTQNWKNRLQKIIRTENEGRKASQRSVPRVYVR